MKTAIRTPRAIMLVLVAVVLALAGAASAAAPAMSPDTREAASEQTATSPAATGVALDPWAVGLVSGALPVDSRDYAQTELDPWAVGLVRQTSVALDPWAVGLVLQSPLVVPVDSRDLLPASRIGEPTAVATTPSTGFDWGDAGIGAAAALLVALLAIGLVTVERHHRHPPGRLAS